MCRPVQQTSAIDNKHSLACVVERMGVRFSIPDVLRNAHTMDCTVLVYSYVGTTFLKL